MAVHNVTGQMLARPKQRTVGTTRIPSPQRGIDTRSNLASADPAYCIYSYNLLPSSYGMRLRSGYREWCIDLEIDESAGIRTIIPFDSPVNDGDDKLFAVTNEAIWDVSEYNNPVVVYTLPIQTGDAGYGNYTHYVNQAGTDLIFYADQENGLLQYNYETDVWEAATGINNVDPADISYVVNHKQRLWLVEKNSTTAWYLPIASIAGDATQFYFGSKFSHGGNLVGLYNWSIDGGDGLDDYLVAVSRSGDVLPYRGSDPSSSDDWENVGVYYIGKVPRGGRLNSEHGGDLYLLSSYGLTSMNQITSGIDTVIPSTDSVTFKISNLIRRRMRESIDQLGWGVVLLPSLGGMVVTAPPDDRGVYLQYFYSTDNQGWGFLRDIPYTVAQEYNGYPYSGGPANKIWISDTYLDDVKITPPEDPTALNGSPIEFSILTNFTDFGEPALFKRIKYLRPDFLGANRPQERTKAVFDYRLNEISKESYPELGLVGAWDQDNWDEVVWSGYSLGATSRLVGGVGIGRMVACATRGQGIDELTLLDWDVVFETGGAT